MTPWPTDRAPFDLYTSARRGRGAGGERAICSVRYNLPLIGSRVDAADRIAAMLYRTIVLVAAWCVSSSDAAYLGAATASSN